MAAKTTAQARDVPSWQSAGSAGRCGAGAAGSRRRRNRSACANLPPMSASITAPCTATSPTSCRCWRWVAEHGWQQFGQRVKKSTAGKAPGEEALIAASLGLFALRARIPQPLSSDGRRARQSAGQVSKARGGDVRCPAGVRGRLCRHRHGTRHRRRPHRDLSSRRCRA